MIEENTGYLPVDDRINAIQILATDKLVMKEAGFIEIFANNEAQTPVYYDNLMVAMSSGYVSEVNAYYPHGMMIMNIMCMCLNDEKYHQFSGSELTRIAIFSSGRSSALAVNVMVPVFPDGRIIANALPL